MYMYVCANTRIMGMSRTWRCVWCGYDYVWLCTLVHLCRNWTVKKSAETGHLTVSHGFVSLWSSSHTYGSLLTFLVYIRIQVSNGMSVQGYSLSSPGTCPRVSYRYLYICYRCGVVVLQVHVWMIPPTCSFTVHLYHIIPSWYQRYKIHFIYISCDTDWEQLLFSLHII